MSKKKKNTKRKDIQSKDIQRTYEASETSRFRKQPTLSQSGDSSSGLAGPRLRAWARFLDENHDIATGILNTLTDNIVGCGVTVEPMVMSRNGKPNQRINDQLREAWEEWTERPEVTGEMTMAEVERLTCRSWLRDGEVLAQKVMGSVAGLEHLGGVPFSLEMIESDYLPFELNDSKLGIIHGVQKNAWGRPRNYYLYKDHPGNSSIGTYGLLLPTVQDTKTVRAENILHVKFTRRIKQTRGVTCLHSVITRLDDYKDFEESERIKARVQAAFTSVITKPLESTSPTNADGDRTFEMAAGMVFDGLNPGESVVSMEATSPTSLLKDYRAEMLRSAAAGTGTSYSSISKNYNGTYSAQRQELVESQPAYRRLREYFISAFTRPVYRAFVDMAIVSGKVSIPRTITPRALYSADFGTVAMPWIDPVKEAQAIQLLLEMGLESKSAAIRARGKNPRMVKEQIEQDEPMEPKENQQPEEQMDNREEDAA